MTNANDKQVLAALEQAIIGLSSALSDCKRDSEPYVELKTKINELFYKWTDLNNKLNPCDIKLND